MYQLFYLLHCQLSMFFCLVIVVDLGIEDLKIPFEQRIFPICLHTHREFFSLLPMLKQHSQVSIDRVNTLLMDCFQKLFYKCLAFLLVDVTFLIIYVFIDFLSLFNKKNTKKFYLKFLFSLSNKKVYLPI